MTDQQQVVPIQGLIVGQYFGLFNGVSKEQYQKIVAAAPFDKCNLLILAFIGTFERNGVYVAQFGNGRDNDYPLDTNDTDADRVRLIVEISRKKNPSLNILVSLGWGANDAGKAAHTPVQFADSLRTLIQAHNLDGLDIDFESVTVEGDRMLKLAKEIKESLNKITPKRRMIMTITPAQTKGLSREVLEVFDYTMPQTYGHGGNGTTAEPYAQLLGDSYSRIVYGLNSENPSDEPDSFADEVKSNNAAGMFAWRLDNDSVENGFPTFVAAKKMWNLMRPAVVETRSALAL